MPVATTVAIEAGWATVLRTFRYVASRYTYGNLTWSRRRLLNASTTSSRPPQMRETSEREIPDSAPNAATRSSTDRVETPAT